MTYDKYTEKPFVIKGRLIFYKDGRVAERDVWMEYKRYRTFEQVIQAWEYYGVKSEVATLTPPWKGFTGMTTQYKPFFENEKHS